MHDVASQENPTPPHGRQGRHTSRRLGQKVYASENDAFGPAAVTLSHTSQNWTPQTPFSGTRDVSSTMENSTTSKSRSRYKNRSKNAVATPDVPHSSRRTPPNSSSATKSNSSTAFAGATFHASPAPSALPLPSFHKTHTGSPMGQDVRRNGQQPPSPPTTEAGAPTPNRLPMGNNHHESPLEAIFRADRAEKERARRASFGNLLASGQDPVSPPNPSPRGLLSTAAYRTDPRTRSQPQRAASGIPLSELDGSPNRHVGPAFATPYRERIRLARAAAQPPSEHSPYPPRDEDSSEALKKYLFGPKLDSTNVSPPVPELSPSKEPSVSTDRPPGLLAMEDDLRRILKLS